MNNTHQFSSQVSSSFSIMDSREVEFFSLMSPAGTDDAAILFIEKGEVTLVHDLKTYILSKGMLLYKIPKVVVQLLSFSKDCHFKVFSFAPQFEIAGRMSLAYLETMTVIASNNPILIIDTLTAATLTVLFWLLQKKISWGENTPSHDETIQHVFSLLMLEVVSSFKKASFDQIEYSHLKRQL